MAAGIPIEKAQQYVKDFRALLDANETLDAFTEKKLRVELSSANTTTTNLALSYLDVITNKEESGLKFLRLCLDPSVNDFGLATHYHHVLLATKRYSEMRRVAYVLAEKYPSKMFSYLAYSWAYRYGERPELERFIDEHIKLLSDDEGREDAMKHKDELLSEMDAIYDSSKCSQVQLHALASIIWSVLSDFNASTGYVQLSGRSGGAYVVDVKNLDSKTIAKMNFELADRICDESQLEGSSLVARFSSPRQLHAGVSYVAN